MGRKTKKGTRGVAAQHLTRTAAVKKLQISLADFRRLCILKGVYPRDPKRKLKGRDKTYYHTKDILHIYHEPVLQKFRDLKVHEKKYRRAIGRREVPVAKGIAKRKPIYSLFHIVKERYPTVLDCLKDLDDAISTLALFASLPADDETNVEASVIAECCALFDQFLLFASHCRLLRKAFCSIKGYYFQIQYLGQPITFLIPHQFPQDLPADVDFKVLLTFVEFYRAVVKSISFKLYHMEGMAYPPPADPKMVRAGCRFLALRAASISQEDKVKDNPKESGSRDEGSVESAAGQSETLKLKLKELTSHLSSLVNNEEAHEHDEEDNDKGDDDAEISPSGLQDINVVSEAEKRIQRLFEGQVFFLSREIPRLPVAFALTACGAAQVGWQGDLSPIGIDDPAITHQVIDRPMTDALQQYSNLREFVQPQWIFDSVNAGALLPVGPYGPGTAPPPHLSPFAVDEGYVPEQRVVLEAMSKQTQRQLLAEEGLEEDEDIDFIEEQERQHQQSLIEEIGAPVEPKPKEPADDLDSKRARKLAEKKNAEKEQAKVLLSKKHKRLLNRIEYSKAEKERKVAKLQKKRLQRSSA